MLVEHRNVRFGFGSYVSTKIILNGCCFFFFVALWKQQPENMVHKLACHTTTKCKIYIYFFLTFYKIVMVWHIGTGE